uniref:Uncharacterized protein n=1 Tax=Sicyonia whispovirus TaxID=2984283 RepID=A0A9C7F8E9_9VIRU|nr:MAG: hypothetical protein [Sicyonia whispovirus]
MAFRSFGVLFVLTLFTSLAGFLLSKLSTLGSLLGGGPLAGLLGSMMGGGKKNPERSPVASKNKNKPAPPLRARRPTPGKQKAAGGRWSFFKAKRKGKGKNPLSVLARIPKLFRK